jgi:hypothetical protein
VYEDLKRRAEQGDPRAQCRLGVDLHRCAHAQILVGTAKAAAQEAAQKPNNESLSAWAKRLAHMSRATNAMCEGFTPDKGERPWRYTLRAALAGNNAAIVNFAFHLNARNPVEDADGWVAYRDYEPELIRRAVDDGYPPAYVAAATLSLSEQLGERFPKDPVRAVAYHMALMSKSSPEYRAALQRDIQEVKSIENLSDAEMAAAAALAVPLAAKLRAPSDGPIDFTQGIRPNNDARECEE